MKDNDIFFSSVSFSHSSGGNFSQNFEHASFTKEARERKENIRKEEEGEKRKQK